MASPRWVDARLGRIGCMGLASVTKRESEVMSKNPTTIRIGLAWVECGADESPCICCEKAISSTGFEGVVTSGDRNIIGRTGLKVCQSCRKVIRGDES